MTHSDRFEPNIAEVAAEFVDGEVILINLSTGAYYSMARTAALIWRLIEQRWSLAEIVAAVGTAYDVADDLARSDVEHLLEQLLVERLVQPTTTPPAREDAVALPTKQRYAPPQLEVFRDLSAMLALDPPMPSLWDASWQPVGR